VPASHLKACEAEGRDGASLPDCVKAYLPQPDGRFGMVFTIDRKADKPALLFLARGRRRRVVRLLLLAFAFLEREMCQRC